MQTKSEQPGMHSGLSRYFGLMYLFQALAAVFMALSEVWYKSEASFPLAILSVMCIAVAVGLCIPAGVSVAIPEPHMHVFHATYFVVDLVILLLFTHYFSSFFKAAPDIPYIPLFLRQKLLGAIVGALFVIAISACIRLRRDINGHNGAKILLAAILLLMAFGLVWVRLEPTCVRKDITDPFPKSCALPSIFDHNFMIATLMLFSNVLAAEGVLRLMAAGGGFDVYAEVVPVIRS